MHSHLAHHFPHILPIFPPHPRSTIMIHPTTRESLFESLEVVPIIPLFYVLV